MQNADYDYAIQTETEFIIYVDYSRIDRGEQEVFVTGLTGRNRWSLKWVTSLFDGFITPPKAYFGTASLRSEGTHTLIYRLYLI